MANKKIRNRVFETNSSSSHSISLTNGVERDQTIAPQNGVVSIYYGEYSREWDKLSSPQDKASYLLTGFSYEEKLIPMVNVLKEALSDFLGCPVEFCELNGFYPKGYVDHQAYDELHSDGKYGNQIFSKIKDKNDILDLVFCSKNCIYTGSDETPPVHPKFVEDQKRRAKYVVTVSKSDVHGLSKKRFYIRDIEHEPENEHLNIDLDLIKLACAIDELLFYKPCGFGGYTIAREGPNGGSYRLDCKRLHSTIESLKRAQKTKKCSFIWKEEIYDAKKREWRNTPDVLEIKFEIEPLTQQH